MDTIFELEKKEHEKECADENPKCEYCKDTQISEEDEARLVLEKRRGEAEEANRSDLQTLQELES